MTPDPQRPGAPDEQTVAVPRNPAPPQAGPPQGWGPPPGYGGPPAPHYPPGPGPQYLPPAQYGPPAPQPTAQYAYNPYGPAEGFPAVEQYPHGYPTPPPAPRPASVYLALLLHLVTGLPYLAGGLLLAFAATALSAQIPQEVLDEAQAQGIDLAGLLRGITAYVVVAGGVISFVALLFLVFAVLAFARRNWARIVVTVMSVPFALIAGFWAFVLLGAASQTSDTDPAAVAIVVGVFSGPGALALLGSILLFLPAANRFFARR